MHRVAFQPIQSQACKTLEVAVEGAEDGTMLDGDGCQVRVVDEIASATGTDQEAGKQRPMSVSGTDDASARMRKPLVHEPQRFGDGKGLRENATLRSEAQKSSQCQPRKTHSGSIVIGFFQPSKRGRVLGRIRIDGIYQHVDVWQFHCGGRQP